MLGLALNCRDNVLMIKPAKISVIVSLVILYSICCYAVNSPPSIGTITPSSGSSYINTAVSFVTTYTDPDGYLNISQAKLIINTSTAAANCFYGYYDCAAKKLYLYNNAGTSTVGGYAPGSYNIIENSYVRLDCSSTTVSGSGNALTINWSITFKAPFTGAKNSYLYVKDLTGAATSWTKVGAWTIANQLPTVGTITPSSGTSNPNQVVSFTTTYSDPDGYLDITQTKLLINTSTGTSNCFYGYYDCAAMKLYLYNDAGTSAIGGYAPGSANIIENSYVKLDCSSTTVSVSGTTLTISWSIAFKSPFTGTKGSYLYVKDVPGACAGWAKIGTWTITNQPPSVGTVTPSSGTSDPNQTVSFTTTYTDPDGYLNMSQAKIIINASATGKNGLYGYYDCIANKLYIYDDAGTTATGGYAPGSANIIENFYAKLDCSSTTVSKIGTTLTIKWSAIFKPSFAGNRNTYLYISDSSANSGFVKKGTWTISNNPVDSSPIITTSLISSVPGAASSNMLGYSVMSAKNINGDNLSDIISAPGSNTGTDIGRVYIYFGGDLTKSPDLTLTGSASGGCFGYSIAVGDVDGDGYDDIIIGEPYNNENGTKAGKVYVYFGGPCATSARSGHNRLFLGL